MTVEALNECYRRGREVRACGGSSSVNPHPFDTPEYSSWFEGWMDLDEHLANRDEALASIGWFG